MRWLLFWSIWVGWGGMGFVSPSWATPSGPQLFLAGQQALEQGKYAEALRLLQQAVKVLPHWGHVHLELAQALQMTGADPSVTAKALEQAQRLLPASNPRIYLVAGLFWEGQGESDKALAYYKQAMTWGHASPQPCLRATRIWLSRRQGKEAIRCLQQLLRQNLLLSETHQLLAEVYTQTQQFKEAQKHWMIALSFQPHSMMVLQKVYLFYAQAVPLQPVRERGSWKRTFLELEQRLKRLLPQNKPRNMRMLQPSRR